MRCGVEFHCRLHRRQSGQRERDQLHRQLVDAGQQPGHQQRRQRLGTAVDVKRRLHRLGRGRRRGRGRRGRRRRDGHRLGERPALQPLQGRHHQHELEHLPDAVGRGRVGHSGGGLRQRGIDLHPEAARDHARVRDRSLRQRELGRCPWCQLRVRERSAAPGGRPELRGLDRRRGRHLHLHLGVRHGSVHRPLRQPAPGRHRLRHRRRPVPVGHPEPRRRRSGSAGAVPEHPVLVHPRHARSIRRQLRRSELPRQRGRPGAARLQPQELRHQPDDDGLRQRLEQRLRRRLRQLRDGPVIEPGGQEPRAHLRDPGRQDRRHPDDRPQRQHQRDLHHRRRGHADLLREEQRPSRTALLVLRPGHALHSTGTPPPPATRFPAPPHCSTPTGS